MDLSVALYQASARKGQVVFHTLLVTRPSDYTCQPEDILNFDEVECVSWELRRLPALYRGAIGKYIWRAE